MENKTCSYEDCNETVNSPHDESLCVFHTPKEKKGITVEEFNQLIWERINGKRLNYRGFIFPGDIYFRGNCREEGSPIALTQDTDFYDAQFHGGAFFKECQFSGNVYFIRVQFSGPALFVEAKFAGRASFNNSKFSGAASFLVAQFSGYSFFQGVQFSGNAIFRGTKFSRNTSFPNAQFSEEASFHSAKFSGDADFWRAQFSGEANFIEAEFLANASFHGAQFAEYASFLGITIESVMIFAGIKMGERAIFNLGFPSFKGTEEEKSHKNITVFFDRVRFNPFAASFEKIYADKSANQSNNPVLIFRYCQLKDVFFTKSDMSLFSFYKSSFDEARFISSRWSDTKDKILGLIPYRRKNVIAEDNMQSEIDKESNEKDKIKLREEYAIQDLSGPDDIASLYRRMKTALDNTKDYQQASWFYFNEFEMKRRALKEEMESHPSKIRNICSKILSKYFLYFSYKVFAGYGEKPLWSFVWFWIWTVVFALGHMVFGLEYFPGGVVETRYEFLSFLKDFSIADFLNEFASSFGYAFSRAIPKTYIPLELSNLNPTNPFGIVWSILNTVILWILIIFIGIGLKRHFRRF